MNNLRTIVYILFVVAIGIVEAGVDGNGHLSVIRTIKAQTHGRSRLNAGLGVYYGQDKNFVKGPDGGPILKNNVPIDGDIMVESGKMISGNVYLGLGVASFIDLAATFPLYYDWGGFESLSSGGPGDVELSVKILYPPPSERRTYYQSFFLAATLPTGSESNGLFTRHPYLLTDDDSSTTFYTADIPVLRGLMLWTIDIGNIVDNFQFQININLGGALSLVNTSSNTVIAGLALEYAPADVITLLVDLWGEERFSNFISGFDLFDDPLMLTPAIKINSPAGVYLKMGADLCLSAIAGDKRYYWKSGDGYQYTTLVRPQFAAHFEFGWSGFLAVQDDDKDGLKNDEDRCPLDPEDIDNFEDNDGCPDLDNDNDGIPDLKDKCPNKTEDKDGFEDADGCPDLDNDKDGIPDIKDLCPRVAEDFDGFEDANGCPDEDNDKDGILDSIDKCPNDPEDIDNFEDSDGCPDIDNDKDGITDLKDKCPNEAEVINGIQDDDGCPDEKKKEPPMPKHQILKGVQFKSGSVEMTFNSYQYLDPIINMMKQYKSIEIEIRGHTDSVGRYSSNMRLSQMRAEAVRQYLLSKGISSKRVRAVGFGPSSPIADNRTAAGRAKNRRIEIIRLK